MNAYVRTHLTVFLAP